ncbi:ChaB family protein [Cronbergia sp. UHCC 0137]|uniref:ChaB family protein n=1 Tax=Cronbergia sp. UHCC 0137 TaxID=3110239 RepID=UPI002B205F39|nr:ChaB family protein [Cronbergia sp. UHCC 0137]MEA5619132.1 ChaB family protein [Cronbergia sp. UHCC 0137]
MLYKSNQELPLDIQASLSKDEQDLYRAAYNSAIHWYGEPDKAHHVGLSAVKMQYSTSISVLEKELNSAI